MADARSSLLRCPPGRYNSQYANSNQTLALLRAHWQRLEELGYRPREVTPAALKRAAQRGFVTYESALWPRPPHCQTSHRRRRRDLKRIRDEPPGTCEPAGTVCDKYRISKQYRFVWHHVWKGGTTSLSPFLSCNFRALPVAGLLRALPGQLPGYLHVGTSREPLQRFLSAFQEVYVRARVRQHKMQMAGSTPTTAHGSTAQARTDAGASTSTPPGRRCWHRHVPWILVAMASSSDPLQGLLNGGCAAPDKPLDASSIKRIFRQFVADVECATHFPNVEHLFSQSLFLGGATSVSQPLDLLLRLESLPTDINDLKKAINFTEAEHCPLKTERAARDKPLTVPHASILRQLLHAERSLLQSVCNIYMQDFLCLGYELPSGCEWLPRSAAISPSTMGITPLALEPGGKKWDRL